jgi:hypothetical protein
MWISGFGQSIDRSSGVQPPFVEFKSIEERLNSIGKLVQTFPFLNEMIGGLHHFFAH